MTLTDLSPLPLTTVVGAFLLAFPALFSIVNPVGAAITFHQVTEGRSDRHELAWRIAFNALLTGSGALLRMVGGAFMLFWLSEPLAAIALVLTPAEIAEAGRATVRPAPRPGGALAAEMSAPSNSASSVSSGKCWRKPEGQARNCWP